MSYSSDTLSNSILYKVILSHLESLKHVLMEVCRFINQTLLKPFLSSQWSFFCIHCKQLLTTEKNKSLTTEAKEASYEPPLNRKIGLKTQCLLRERIFHGASDPSIVLLYINGFTALKPYLFTHPNPNNAIISWIISWQTLTIFLSCMV